MRLDLHFISVLFFLFSASAFSFQLNSGISITQKRGLSHNSVTATIKDKYGFLWISTRDGLNKFDGYSVLSFFTPDRELGTVTDNYFSSMSYFGGDSIFLSMGSQIYVFNISTNHFSVLPFLVDGQPYTDDGSVIHQINGNGLLIGGYNGGLYRYDLKTKTAVSLSSSPEWKKNISEAVMLTGILTGSDGSVWISSLHGGLIHYDEKKQRVKSYSLIPYLKDMKLKNSIRSMTWKSPTQLYIGTWGYGVWIFDTVTETFKQIWYNTTAIEPHAYNDIKCLFQDEDKTIWFGTNGSGLYHADENGNVISNYSVKGDENHFLADNDVYTIFKEKKGIYWIGTDGAGLQQINLEKQNFNQLNSKSERSLRLNNDDVQKIFIDSHQRMWVATNGGGVNFISSDKQNITYLTMKSKIESALHDNTVYTITEDQFSRIWIGSNSGGIQVYFPKKNQFINPPKMYKGPYNFIYMLFADSHGNMWVSSYLQNLVITNIKNSLNSFLVDTTSLQMMEGSNFQTVIESRTGNVWIGTNSKGVFKWDYKEKKLYSLTKQFEEQPGPKPRNITSLYEDRWNNIWISTSGTGLFCWLRNENQLIQITEKDGLISNNITDLVGDKTGNLWVSSPLGLGLVEIVDYQTKTGYQLKYYEFNHNDGINNEVFSRNSGTCDRKGIVYFGGNGGITYFSPEDIELQSPFQPIIPTKLLINNQQLDYFDESTGKNINEVEELTFDYRQYIISIEVTALEFSNPDKINYAYQMQGLNDQWVNTQTRRYFTFTSLPSGNYTLKIKSTNTLGNWNDQSRDIHIHILPPWWLSWWAYTAYILTTVTLLIAFIQWRSRKLNQDKKILEEVVLQRTHELNQTAEELKVTNNLLGLQTERLQRQDKKKTELFTNISHEFRTPLTLILNPLENLAKSNQTQPIYSMMFRNATRLNRLINQLLAIAKADSGELQLHLKTIDFAEFVKLLVSDFASLASQQNRVVTESYPKTPVIFSFDPDHMEKVITNLLSNSFKFTNHDDEIRVHVFTETADHSTNGFAILEVEDSGIGIPKDQIPFLFDRFFQVESGISRTYEGSGIGLSLVKQLVEMHNGKIEVSSEQGAGTKMRVAFPITLHSENENSDHVEFTSFTSPIIQEIPDLIDAKLSEISDQAKDKKREVLKVLLVEDNQDLLAYVKGLLSAYDISTSADGEEGLETAIREVPDLIISDVMMPKMDGYTLTKKLKNNPVTWHIPIILLTAKSSLENKITGLDEGADVYLTKPFQTGELLAVLENLLRSRDKLKNIYISKLNDEFATQDVVSKDDLFIQTVIGLIEENISNTKFGVEELAEEVHLSRSQLHRKLTAVIGQSPVVMIRSVRMKRAKILIENKAGTISEIAVIVGFDNLAYFSKCFRETFKVAPSEVI